MKKAGSHKHDAAKVTSFQLKKITADFQSAKLSNEDDVKNLFVTVTKNFKTVAAQWVPSCRISSLHAVLVLQHLSYLSS